MVGLVGECAVFLFLLQGEGLAFLLLAALQLELRVTALWPRQVTRVLSLLRRLLRTRRGLRLRLVLRRAGPRGGEPRGVEGAGPGRAGYGRSADVAAGVLLRVAAGCGLVLNLHHRGRNVRLVRHVPLLRRGLLARAGAARVAHAIDVRDVGDVDVVDHRLVVGVMHYRDVHVGDGLVVVEIVVDPAPARVAVDGTRRLIIIRDGRRRLVHFVDRSAIVHRLRGRIGLVVR